MLEDKYTNDNNYCKVNDHCFYTGQYKVATKIYVIYKIVYPKKFSLVFHHELNYDYHFFIEELATKFQTKFNCLGEKTEK